MIISRLTGGLGNQFFQYAAGRALSQHLGVSLKYDITHYENNIHRKYLLDNFNVSGKIATVEEIKHLKPDNFFNKIVSKVLGTRNKYIFNEHVFNEPKYRFYKKFFKLPSNTYLDGDGRYQSYRYFENIENIIRNEFTLKYHLPKSADLLINNINTSNSVSIHIRRGDYFATKNQKIFNIPNIEYYQKAISLIQKKISDPYFFVFSDDLLFTHTLSFPRNTIHINKEELKLEDFHELIVMSKCKHNITANSTFSWWAGWLNANPNKIVITPKKWFVDETMYSDDLIPEDWIKL